jgi:hypothetical protein
MSRGSVKVTVDETLLILLTYVAFIDNRLGNDKRPIFVKVHRSHDVEGIHK